MKGKSKTAGRFGGFGGFSSNIYFSIFTVSYAEVYRKLSKLSNVIEIIEYNCPGKMNTLSGNFKKRRKKNGKHGGTTK